MRLLRSRRTDVAGAEDGQSGAAGGLLEEIDDLVRRNRKRRDPELERRLVGVRRAAFDELAAALDSGGRAPQAVDEAAIAQGLPVLPPEELSSERVRGAILAGGCAHVPGLLPAERARELSGGIDRVFAACDGRAQRSVGDDAWYEPFDLPASWSPGLRRKWNRDGGAVWAADSPRLLFELLDAFERLGLRELMTGYLGERPIVSMNKSVLRRVSAGESGGDWHQDGAFMGAHIRSLNVWLALSDCGRDAPGMDVVPRRLEEIVETGGPEANFDWSVSSEVVERVAGDAGVVRPLFRAGDALLFDHLFLHRTAADPGMSRDRYAIETWFFAPSTRPSDQIPLVF